MYLGELSPQGQAAAAAVPLMVSSDRQQLLDIMLATPEGKSHESSTQMKGIVIGVFIGAAAALLYKAIRK